MNDILLFVCIGLLLIVIVLLIALLILILKRSPQSTFEAFEKAQKRTEDIIRQESVQNRGELAQASREQRRELIEAFEKAQKRTEDTIRQELGQNRSELIQTSREQRQELTEAFKTFGDRQKEKLDDFSTQFSSFDNDNKKGIESIRTESATRDSDLRQEIVTTLTSISETMTKAIKAQLEQFSGQVTSLTKTSSEKLDGIKAETGTGAKQLREEVIERMHELSNLQRKKLEDMSSAIDKLSDSNEKKLESVRNTIESKLQSIQNSNDKQLDQMRQTVDEKLQGTLEKRLGESFKQVSERLEMVHKGLGEMQTLATGVGDLKKVLTNVKTRGTWGEVQLGVLLEQVLNHDQFAANVSTKNNSERVEFAVKLPGQGSDKNETVLLPIDAKFPIEDYQRLIEAQELTDIEGVEAAGKQLEIRVRACAKDICEKYLNPPKSTDFGILFLPIEGLFAEVIRRTGLTETIQRDYRVVIAGPTTLWAILSSLQMGFRTLAIQKRSSEVWNILAGVKTEWTKYGESLEMVQRKLEQVSNSIETAKTRSNAIGRKLKSVHELPMIEAAALLKLDTQEDDENVDIGD